MEIQKASENKRTILRQFSLLPFIAVTLILSFVDF